MNTTSRILVGAIAFGLLSSFASAGTLGIGSPAPSISVFKWIKGKPVNLKDGGVHVVEFWATWCGPCKESIPHLTELAKKFKGQADFTGVSVYEHGTAGNVHIPMVEKFVKDQGEKMDYNVAADGEEGIMAKAWMQAANQGGIPTAFIVGKEGTILWIGHPMVGLEETLDQVVAGKFDVAKAQADQDAKRQAASQQAELMKPYQAAIAKKDYKGAVNALDKLMAKMPDQKAGISMTKFTLMLKYDEAGAQKFGAEIGNGVCSKDAMMLNSIAWAILDPEAPLKKPDVALALKLAQKSADLLENKDPYSLDTLALAQFKSGKLDAAIASSTKAVGLAKAAKGFDPSVLKEISDRLAMFKAKKGKG